MLTHCAFHAIPHPSTLFQDVPVDTCRIYLLIRASAAVREILPAGGVFLEVLGMLLKDERLSHKSRIN